MAKTKAGNGILSDLFSRNKDKKDSSNSDVIRTDNPVWSLSGNFVKVSLTKCRC